MRQEPRIAVYMSCYNHEKYVAEAMDSILNQTYSNLELFVVNDASTDNTGRILEQYTDERVHYYDFKVNTKFVGAANFLQKLIRDMDFDYIASMASDDKWETDKLEKQLAFLAQHPEYRACFTWDKVIFSGEDPSFRGKELYSHRGNDNRFNWLYDLAVGGNCLNANSMLMEKEVFYEIGRMNENYIQLGDWRAWLRFSEKYPFYLVPEELTYYRRHDTNLSKGMTENKVRGVNETGRIYQELFAEIKKDTFRRAFYRNLIYTDCDSEEEFLAEKFTVLCNLFNYASMQAAMNLYFDHCDNEAFVSLLEERYFFGANEFIHFTGNAGLVFWVNSLKKVLPSSIENSFSPANLLLRAIESGKLQAYSMHEYMYSGLTDLYHSVKDFEGGSAQFARVRQIVDGLREQRRMWRSAERRILIVLATDAGCDVKTVADSLPDREGAVFFVAVVPKKEELLTEGQIKEQEAAVASDMKVVRLYDEKEHCIRFLTELSERVDAICYVDCLDQRYECGEMVGGHSLDVEHSCILRQEIYDRMTREDDTALQMMQSICVY